MQKPRIKINCDLGESYGSWIKGADHDIMPYIDLANIACGFHAGDPLTLANTVALAKKHNVTIGAHPAYSDLQGFGRRSIIYSPQELTALIQYQLGALQGLCNSQGETCAYVKPHGALYNDMMKNSDIFQLVCSAVKSFSPNLPIVVQALPDNSAQRRIAKNTGITLWFEAFADRHYQDNGLLVPRSEKDAVIHCVTTIAERCKHLMKTGELLSINGKVLNIQVDTLCVHGDHPTAVEIVKTICAIK